MLARAEKRWTTMHVNSPYDTLVQSYLPQQIGLGDCIPSDG